MNYCQRLWKQFNILDSAHKNCATILDLAKAKGESQFDDLDSALSETEAKLSDMQEQWNNSFETLPNGELLFGPEYEMVVKISESLRIPLESFSNPLFTSLTSCCRVSDGHITQLNTRPFGTNPNNISYIAVFKHLEKLDLYNFELENLSFLKKIKLKKLTIRSRVKDWSDISTQQDLEELSLPPSYISNENLHHLSTLKKLKDLGLYSQLRKADLSFLLQLPDLKIIRFEKGPDDESESKFLDETQKQIMETLKDRGVKYT